MRALLRIAATAAAVLIAPPAAADWREASTDRFIIYADAGEKWLRGFADRLERSAAALDRLRAQPDAELPSKSNRLVIYAVPGTGAVEKLCGKCGSVAGFYVPRVGHSVAYTARTDSFGAADMTSDIVLLHEYAHHVLLSSRGVALPRWYNEGFAEFYSTLKMGPDGAVDIGEPAKHRAYNMLNASMKIEHLLDSSGKTDDLSQDIFYGRAWLLTHMLTFDDKRRGQLARYLDGLNAGKPNLEAARAAFGDLGVLQKDMEAYLRKPLRRVRLAGRAITVGPVAVRTLSPGEAAMMPVRLRSDRGVGRQAALEIVADARTRAAPYPDDPDAQIALAEAEYDAGNDTAADAAADRALAVRPNDVEALMYKGRVAVRQARAARSRDPLVWTRARNWFVKANRAENDAAEPLLLFYRSFGAAGVKPTANAATGLFRALELSPQEPGLRIAAARQYVIDGKLDEARAALLPLAFDPHVPAERNRFTRVVAAIDAKRPVDEILRLGSGRPAIAVTAPGEGDDDGEGDLP